MKQDANQAAEASQPGMPAPKRPTAALSRRWLEEQVWTLPLLDERSSDAILGDCNAAPGIEPGAGCANTPGPLAWSDNQSEGCQ